MQIKDSEIARLVERLGEHYRANISNRYLRPALLQLPMDNQAWDLMEGLTEKSEQFRYQGAHLDLLYRQLASAARFVQLARSGLGGNLRLRTGGLHGGDSDRVLRDMAINAFPSNLRVFADMLNELYVKLVEVDKAQAAGRVPLYMQLPELKDIGRHLVG